MSDDIDDDQRLAEQEAAKRKKRIDDDLNTVLATPAGRRLIWKLLGDLGVFSLCYSSDSDRDTAFNLGARNQGLRMLAHIHEVCPERYLEMVVDAQRA